MVYDKGQLVALAVGGGGAVVAAVVLAYLIKRYRESSSREGESSPDVASQNVGDGNPGAVKSDDEPSLSDRAALLASIADDSRESTPTADSA